jgi:uncharacterized protein YacL
MRKEIVLLFCLFFILNIVVISAEYLNPDPDASGAGDADMQQIQNLTDQIPINDSGIDTSKIVGWKSAAEQRIDAINEYVGPISNIIIGRELSFSMLFIYALLIWLLLAEFISAPISDVFGVKSFIGVLIALVVSSLAMHSYAQNLVVWIDSIATAWWAAILAIFSAIVFGAIYAMFMKTLGKKIDAGKEKAGKEKEKQDREILHVGAENVEEEYKPD